jgi:hypothetical protein
MPFTLSLKPQQTEVILPAYQFKTIYEAENKADEILKTYSGLYYVGVFFSDEHTPTRLITNIVQRGYKQVSWTQYKYFDRFNRIKNYFVLNGNHYVKLFTYQK